MPIYEYQGQQYDIATEDPAAAKAKILKYIGTQGEAKGVDKPQAKDAGFSFGDLAKSFGMGATGSTKALTDVAGAGNIASEKLDETTKSIQKSMTPERQAELKRQAARMKAAEESGSMLQEMKAGALNVIEAPLQSTAQALGSFVPYLPALFAAPAAVALRLGPVARQVITKVAEQAPKVIGTAQGVGAVKGSIYEGVLEAEIKAGVKPEVAKKKADAAQAYFGPNFEQIALGGGLGFVAGSSGVEKFLTPAGRAGASKNLGRRISESAVKESIPEGAQGGQERLAQNIALQRAGYDVDTFAGVTGAATQEALTGALGAAPVAAVSRPSPIQTETETQGTAPPPPPATQTTATTPEQVRAKRIAALTEINIQQGIPAENAEGIATRKVDAELKAEAKAASIKVPEGRVEQITQDLIAAGVDPQQAVLDAQRLAQEESQADELAQNETGGVANVAEPINEPIRTSPDLVEQPSTELPPGGVAGVDTSGMVSPRPTTTGATVGERVEPTALEEAPPAETPAPTAIEEAPPVEPTLDQDIATQKKLLGTLNRARKKLLKDENLASGDPRIDAAKAAVDKAQNEYDVFVAESEPRRTKRIEELTKGADLGTETTEAIETTQEEQAPPTAGGVAGKRGPKPKPAEVKAQIRVSRNEQNRINNYAEDKRKKFVAQLQQTLTPEQIEELSFEEAEQAEIDARQSRRSALRGLVELQDNPNIARGSAVGKRISAALKDSKATEAELADIRRGIKAAKDVLTGPKEDVLGSVAAPGVSGKTEAKANKSADAKVGKPDAGFSKLTNGSQAITQIIKTGNLFQRFVAQRIRNFMVGVKFVVVEKGDATPANILEELKGARGLFVYTPGQKERTVYVRGSSFGDQQGINNVTVLHELLHAATASRIEAGLLKGFRNASLQKFMREMDAVMKRAEQEYKDLTYLDMVSEDLNDLVSKTYNPETDSYDIFKSPHEFLAYGMSSPEFQKFLMRVKGVRKEPTLFSTFVNSIRDLFGIKQGDATAFSDLVDITDKMLGTRLTAVGMGRTSLQQKGKFTPPEFDEEADSKVKRSALQLARDTKIAKEKVRLSNEGDAAKNVELMQLARDPKAVRQILANVTSDLGYTRLEATVRLPTFDFLAKWAADVGIPALNKANTQMQRMLGMSQQFLVGAERVIDSLNRGFKEDPKLSRKQFADFVYATTLAEVDPSDTNTRIRSKQLDADYKALGSVGQRMYKQLRDYYESIIELYSDILDEQISNMQGMSPDEKKNLMAVLRKTFEAESRIKPFFPLVRRGDFFLAIGSGDTRQFYLFETRAERNEAAKQMAAERGKSLAELIADKEFVQGNDLKELRAASQDASTMLKEVFAAIDAKDMGSPEAKEGLKDAVYQIYLTTMPEQSFRRQFTHRKGRAGFSTDLQRNIATTASKQSIQLARLKYAPQLRLALSEARDSIGEREELSPFVQEAEKRVNMALSGAHGSLSESVAGVANKASYFWYLSSAASALIQPSSVFISGLPVLGGNYNNVTGAATELAKMATLVNQYSVFRPNPDGTTSISAPSIANNKSLPADERKAISEMTSRGVSESTYASLVWGYKSMSTEQFEGVVGKGKRLANLMVGALMHNTERLSREAVYLAAYRLGKKQGLGYDAAVQKAVDSTNEALGNYDITNRPRFMQQGIGKIAFQFKTYPLQMSLLLLTNFKNMLPYLNKEGKKEAATKFFGMMGTSFLLAGAANMALINPILGLAGWAWSQMSDDEDWPEELKGINFPTWVFEVFLPEKLGDITLGGVPVSDLITQGPFNALTGLAIGSRIGLADLWGRDSKETKTSRESAIAFLLDHFGGPTASMGLGFADAYDAYAMGDYQKMLDRMLPAVARNLVIANRYADEGMKTGRGVELVGKDDVKTGELIGQAIGFRPDILASTQGPAFKLSGIDQKINNQRNLLLNKLDFQRRKDTDEGDEKFDDIIDNEVAKFNDKYPSYRLNRDTINESLKKRGEQRADSRAGVNVTKQNKPIIEEVTDTLENRLDRRAEEMAAKRRAEKNPQ
jgi:hypothetical protein